jgi:mRNA interferase YafQ
MRTIERTSQFKKDYKRELRGVHRATLPKDLAAVVLALANDRPLSSKFHDHPLIGEWKDFRDCHIRPDLVMIYRKSEAERLQLVRLGSHSELGL